MEHEKLNIAQKLLHVQQNLKAPKGQYNSFGKYHYRSCEDIQEALKPLLAEVKAVLLISDEIVQIGDRFYIRAAASLQDVESGEKITNIAYARECESKAGMDAAQITGSCSSYARKYALNGLFCIDDAKDPDSMENGTDARQQDSGAKNRSNSRARQQSSNNRSGGVLYVNQQHINTIRAEIARTGAKEAAVCYQYHIKSLQEMTMEQFKNAMLIFRQMQNKEPEESYQMTLDGIAQYEDEMPFR